MPGTMAEQKGQNHANAHGSSMWTNRACACGPWLIDSCGAEGTREGGVGACACGWSGILAPQLDYRTALWHGGRNSSVEFPAGG